jgi:hypothetical protein
MLQKCKHDFFSSTSRYYVTANLQVLVHREESALNIYFIYFILYIKSETLIIMNVAVNVK